MKLAIKGGSEEAIALRMPHYKKAIERFTAKTGIDVELISGSDNDLAYRTQIKTKELKADIVLIDSLWIPELVEYLEPLDSFVKGWDDWSSYHERAKALGEYGGHIYGIPHEMDVRGIFYNRDILKEEWKAESLEEVIEMSEKLKCQIPMQIYYGTDAGESAMSQGVLPIFYAFGGKLYDGRWEIKSKSMLLTLRYYYDVFVSKALCSKISPSEARELFALEKIGILFDGMWCWNEFWGKGGKFPVEGREKKISFVSVPGIKGPVNLFAGWVFSVASSAAPEAKELLKELCSEEVTERICTLTSHVAPRKDAIESSAYSEDPFLVECTEMLDNCFFRPKAKEYSLVSYQILRATEMVVDGMHPRKALRDLSKRVNGVLTEP
jgi:multiple sugar transport system substrate-binding protein